MSLKLVEVKDVGELQPGACYERKAAQYVSIGIHGFRKLVAAGEIAWTRHRGQKRRLFLKVDLDAYLQSLKRERCRPRIAAVGDPPNTAAIERRNT